MLQPVAMVVCASVDKATKVHEQYKLCMDMDRVLLMRSGPVFHQPSMAWEDYEKIVRVSQVFS